MTIARTRTFRSGNSKALRLPRDDAFGDDVELALVRSRHALTVHRATVVTMNSDSFAEVPGLDALAW